MSEFPEMLACPFCGGINVRVQQNGWKPDRTPTWWEAVCDDCDFCGPGVDTREECMAHWNHRADLTLSPDEYLALKDIISACIECDCAPGHQCLRCAALAILTSKEPKA